MTVSVCCLLRIVFLFKSDPEQSDLLLCYDQLGSVLELSLPSCFQDSVCRSETCSSGISYPPADIQDIVLTLVTPPQEFKLKTPLPAVKRLG